MHITPTLHSTQELYMYCTRRLFVLYRAEDPTNGHVGTDHNPFFGGIATKYIGWFIGKCSS